jgi:hypothetical protein
VKPCAEDAGAGRDDDFAGGVVRLDDVVRSTGLKWMPKRSLSVLKWVNSVLSRSLEKSSRTPPALDPGFDGVAAGLVHIVRAWGSWRNVGRGDDVDRARARAPARVGASDSVARVTP